MVTVQLNEEEMIRAFTTGIKRQFAHRDPVTGKRFSTHRFTAYDSDFIGDIKGCIVECAVAKYYGTTWNSETWKLEDHNKNKGEADVAPNFEVRRSRTLQGELTVRSTDLDFKIAILGYVDSQSENMVTLMGAMPIKYVKEHYSSDAKGNYYVPSKDLFKVEEYQLNAKV